ncbi:MAG: hypothetical protein GX610_02260 [Rhodococcus sp.]|nr:hypothetical protein [Rhodococcus sp. (in: high G+C Gram-positive bacteria)]
MAGNSGPAANSNLDADWLFFAEVGTSVHGGHSLAAFGPLPSALDALALAINSINHTAYSLFEQGYTGSFNADAHLVERLPITSFTIRRHDPDTRAPDNGWMLTGKRHHRARLGGRGAA